MLTLDTVTQPATLGRRASCCRSERAYFDVATPIPAVGPTGLWGFGQGSGLPTVPATKPAAAHMTAVPATALRTTALPSTARMTDQTPAATGNGSLGNHVRRRPPA